MRAFFAPLRGTVFPARAGMIRQDTGRTDVISSIPRESGDDPTVAQTIVAVVGYSPRERG